MNTFKSYKEAQDAVKRAGCQWVESDIYAIPGASRGVKIEGIPGGDFRVRGVKLPNSATHQVLSDCIARQEAYSILRSALDSVGWARGHHPECRSAQWVRSHGFLPTSHPAWKTAPACTCWVKRANDWCDGHLERDKLTIQCPACGKARVLGSLCECQSPGNPLFGV